MLSAKGGKVGMIWNDDTEETIGINREEKYGRLNITYVNIIRCKDCRFGVERIDELRNPCIKCEKHPIYHPLEWFCADGEKK